jgi:hypothetical protein
MTTVGRGSDESLDESQGKESDAPPDRSQTEMSHEDRISRRAYERFEMRGGAHGRDQDDWLEAERELNKAADE